MIWNQNGTSEYAHDKENIIIDSHDYSPVPWLNSQFFDMHEHKKCQEMLHNTV